MTTRQPLQTLSPPSANIIDTRYAHFTNSANGIVAMEEQIQDDAQDQASVVSGLSSLENDADDFEKLMIQNARDERRLNQALHGRVQAFRKARTHPRVGLTIDNLERNNARNDAALEANAHAKNESPPSSNGSARSDPTIHAPPGWGRKSRSNRNWMRSITYEEQQQQQQRTPVAADGPINGYYDDPYPQYAGGAQDANVPRRSVEDSPLSHKSAVLNTPPNDHSAEWDLTFELNEASMIASTPYIPRNTALDDIRQREMESAKEQGAATAQLGRIREGSPEHTRRPRSYSTKSTNDAANDLASTEQATQGAAPLQKRPRRMLSWQAIGKAQPVTGIGKANSPVPMYKSAENIATLDHSLASAQNDPSKRVAPRRGDSQDLLRRLARASNTPSPNQIAPSRPQTAPGRHPNSSSQTMVTDTPPTPPEGKEEFVFVGEASILETVPERPTTASEVPSEREEPKQEESEQDESEQDESEQDEPKQDEPKQDEPKERSPEPESPPEPLPETGPENVDATPMPVERTILNPKTPVITGAWIDTPGPRTTLKAPNTSRSRSLSPKKLSPRKSELREKQAAPAEEALQHVAIGTVRPSLPSSALHALVQEAKAHDRQQSADYGDSTINSLEDLITPLSEIAEGDMDEDTLQGLQLPTGVPRNEAERQRQQELLHLHRMNDRLRAARTSIRDASRGMKRVEDRVDHVDDGETGERTKVVVHKCACANDGGHEFSMWRWSKSFFWQERLKTLRQVSNSRWTFWGGLTGLGIFLTVFFTWWVSEEIACEIYCQPMYAHSSRYPFAVNMNAPQYPFVIPTLIYRNLIKAWWAPIYSFVSWIGITIWKIVFGFDEERAHIVSQAVREGLESTATIQRHWAGSTQVADELGWDLGMMDDERM